MDRQFWLRDLGALLRSFPVGEALSAELYAEIQAVVDETIIAILESGGDLPTFILQSDRLDAIRDRLGEQRLSELAAKPLTRQELQALEPLAVQLCAFDTLADDTPERLA